MSKLQLINSNHLRWLRIGAVSLGMIALIWGMIWIIMQATTQLRPKVEAIPKSDTRMLDVTIIEPERETVNDFTEVTIISNKPVTMKQAKDTVIQSIGESGGMLYYMVTISGLEPEKPKEVTLSFTDEVNQEYSEKVTVTRTLYYFPQGMDEIIPWENSQFVLDGDNLKATVDKTHRLLEDYEPNDLVDLNKRLGLFTLNNAQLRSEAGFALKSMLDDMQAETGKTVTVASGYRSFYTQSITYGSWVKELGQQGADQVSARPGHSEHQLGTTVDFVSAETEWKISNKFGDTVAGKWLSEHASEYGFVIPYNQDNTAAGGYKEESWHFRYVGKDN
jgi:LAS superfamily LD-carboxypeptidase LdcB